VLDQFVGPGLLTAGLAVVAFLVTFNRKDAREAVETAGMNTDQAMKRAEAAENRERELRDRLALVEAENERLRRLLHENGLQA
jgi:hypothetical protein